MVSTPPFDYQTAYRDIFPKTDRTVALVQGAREAAQFAEDQAALSILPVGIVRHTFGRLPDATKEKLVAAAVSKADEDPTRDYTSVIGEVYQPEFHGSTNDDFDYPEKLNYQLFQLCSDKRQLLKLDSPDALSDYFPAGKRDEWPVITLLSNGNLVSPQSYFDTYRAADALVPQLVPAADGRRVIVAGTYFSQRHVNANAQDTITRYNELGRDPLSMKHASPAAHILANQILSLIAQRDADGNVQAEEGDDGKFRPVLRADARTILKHVVGYGYSVGHMTNKDAVRSLRGLLNEGMVISQTKDGKLFQSSMWTAEQLLRNISLIGVAGMDNLEADSRAVGILNARATPHEVVFLSGKDLSIALNGPDYLHSAKVIKIDSPGHDQWDYANSIGSNAAAKQQARDVFSSQGLGVAR